MKLRSAAQAGPGLLNECAGASGKKAHRWGTGGLSIRRYWEQVRTSSGASATETIESRLPGLGSFMAESGKPQVRFRGKSRRLVYMYNAPC